MNNIAGIYFQRADLPGPIAVESVAWRYRRGRNHVLGCSHSLKQPSCMSTVYLVDENTERYNIGIGNHAASVYDPQAIQPEKIEAHFVDCLLSTVAQAEVRHGWQSRGRAIEGR
jgi:hypothetical protein